MAARDGFPFSVFCTSPDLRKALKSMGFKDPIPKSPATVREIVMLYGKSIRDRQLLEIQRMKEDGIKFCATFDEWTSNKNRRFMSIILHGQGTKFWNLGLVRITGSLTSENAVTLVASKLLEHHISLRDDIICIMTDGTSVMTKIGRLSPTEQQLCLAHGTQLAVADVLYPKNRILASGSRYEDCDDDSDEEDGEDVSDPLELSSRFELESNETPTDVSHEMIAPIISKVYLTNITISSVCFGK